MPAAASAANHSPMTGANSRPTAVVPWRWIANRPLATAIVQGRMIDDKLGAATSMPSTADSTEIAGVIIPSA